MQGEDVLQHAFSRPLQSLQYSYIDHKDEILLWSPTYCYAGLQHDVLVNWVF